MRSAGTGARQCARVPSRLAQAVFWMVAKRAKG